MNISYHHRQEIKRIGMQTGKNALERSILLAAEAVKFVFQLLQQMLSQFFGR